MGRSDNKMSASAAAAAGTERSGTERSGTERRGRAPRAIERSGIERRGADASFPAESLEAPVSTEFTGSADSGTVWMASTVGELALSVTETGLGRVSIRVCQTFGVM